MAASLEGWKGAVAGAVILLCAVTCSAQQTTYRCATRGGIVYTQIPCAGGRVVGKPAAHDADKWKVPPQDRAVRARRAQLSPADRQECSVLDGRLRDEQHALKDKGAEATLQDEMPLVQTKKKFRELHC